MAEKTYSLLSSEPLTDFENSVARALHTLAENGVQPRAAVLAVLDENGYVVTCYHNANLQDMMILKGYLELDIQSDALGINGEGDLENTDDTDDADDGEE